jgi:hypothetical protein
MEFNTFVSYPLNLPSILAANEGIFSFGFIP